MDAEELHEHAKAHLERLRRGRVKLVEQGPAAAHFVTALDRQIRHLDKHVKRTQRLLGERAAAQDNLLQATANLADAEYAAFRNKKAIVDKLYELNPLDPEVQRLKEEMDELAKQFPKE